MTTSRVSRSWLAVDPAITTLFLTKNGRPLDGLAVVNAVRRHLKRAGIDKPIRPHRLRHACATHMLKGGADIRHIQKLLGHASLQTTQIYAHVENQRSESCPSPFSSARSRPSMMRSLHDAAIAYREHLAPRLVAGSVRRESGDVLRFVDWMLTRHVVDLIDVTRAHIEGYRTHLTKTEYRSRAGMKKLGARTRYDRLASVQRFFAWTIATRQLVADPSIAVARGRRGAWQPESALTEMEIVMLLEAPDPATPIGMRYRAALELLYSTGLRRAEIVELDLTDVDLAERIIIVRRGKGSRQRIVPLGETAAEALVNYLTKARPLFPRTRALQLSSSSRRVAAKRDAACARVRSSPSSAVPLTARRSENGSRHICSGTASQRICCAAGANVRHVQELLGHRRIDSTETYTHLNVTDLATAHARAHPRGRQKR